MSNYTDLIDDRLILWDLNSQSPFSERVNNCPSTADAVDNFLNTGDRIAAVTSCSRFNLQSNFTHSPWAHIVNSLTTLGSDHHYVIRGNRARGSRYARTHFFVLANVRNTIYLIDAYTHEILSAEGITGYRHRGEFVSYDFATQFEATPPPTT